MINNSFKSLEIAYSIALKYITNFDEVNEISNKIEENCQRIADFLSVFVVAKFHRTSRSNSSGGRLWVRI